MRRNRHRLLLQKKLSIVFLSYSPNVSINCIVQIVISCLYVEFNASLPSIGIS